MYTLANVLTNNSFQVLVFNKVLRMNVVEVAVDNLLYVCILYYYVMRVRNSGKRLDSDLQRFVLFNYKQHCEWRDSGLQ